MDYDLNSTAPTEQRKREFAKPDEWIVQFIQDAGWYWLPHVCSFYVAGSG